MGRRKPGQKTHGQVSRQGEEGISWRMSHLMGNDRWKSGVQNLSSIDDGLTSLWVGHTVLSVLPSVDVCVPNATIL